MSACHGLKLAMHMYHTAVGVCTGVAVTALSSLCFIYTDLLVFSLGGRTVSWMVEKQFHEYVPLQKKYLSSCSCSTLKTRRVA